MSTKIYYGKKLHIKDLNHLKTILEKVRLENENLVLSMLPTSLVKEGKVELSEYQKLIEEYNLQFAVGYDSVTASYYGFLLGHHGQQKLVESVPEFEDFSYWDNVDPPEDIPEEQFYGRGEVWNRLIPNYSPIGDQMFCINLSINIFKHKLF